MFFLLLQQAFPAPLGVVVQGVVIGTLTALISFGLALIYRSDRIINFAQADLGAVPAGIGVMLIVNGWSFWLAIPVALTLGAALGAIVERVIIRRFAEAPRLILMVVTVGLAQLLAGLGTAVPFIFGATFPPQDFPSPFDFSFSVDPIVFRGNDLLAIVAAPAMALALVFFLQRTSVGTAMRAAAESASRASLLGVNVGRIRLTVWTIAAVMSTVAMVLRAGVLGLPLGSPFGPSILLRALAAAVIGRMERFGTMFAAACGLGIVETAIIWNKDSATLVDPVLFALLLAVLLVQRHRGESRVDDQATSTWQDGTAVRPVPVELRHLPQVRAAGHLVIGVLVGLALAVPLVLSDADLNRASAACIFGVVAISLVLLTGWTGEISLGQVAFMGIGAAVGGTLAQRHHWDVSLVLVAAGLVGAVAATLVGAPALRLRRIFLPVTTMAFALATSSFLLNPDYFGYLPDNVTEQVRRLPLFGLISIETETQFFYLSLAVLTLAIWCAHGLRASRIFRQLIAVRDNERGTASFGIDTTRTKLLAFAASGFFAAAAGGLFALHQQAVGSQAYDTTQSIRALTMVVIGGLVSIPGAVSGAIFLQLTDWLGTKAPLEYRFFVSFAGSGIALLVILWFLPGGIGALLYRARDRYLRRVATREGITVASVVADRRDAADGASARRPEPTASRPTTAGLLEVEAIDVSYAPVQILFGLDVDVTEGDTVALLGTNGAGKSTVLRAISGQLRPTAGSIRFDGHDITRLPAHRIAALGLVQVPGGKGVFPSLTVEENLALGAYLHRKDAQAVARDRDEVLDLFPALRPRLHEPSANLSGGQQQMLTLAMGFLSRPKLLMIDELSLGLAPIVVEQLLTAVRAEAARGTTILVVEQSVNVALTLASRAYFLEKGEVRFHGPTADLLERPDVLRSVFLRGAAERPRTRPAPAQAAVPSAALPLLSIRNLTKSFAGNLAVDDLSFDVRPGEILGVIGPNGAGKTTVLDLLSGFLEADTGSISLGDEDITELAAHRRAELGIARSFQDARLFGGLTVHEVVSLALSPSRDSGGLLAHALHVPEVVLAERAVAAGADDLLEQVGLARYRDKFVAELSTGTRRMVDLACQLSASPAVLLFDEPSSGIAQREAEALAPLLLQMQETTGAALVVVEHDMPLLKAVAGRFLALDYGRYVTDGPADEVLDHPDVVRSYLGSDAVAIGRSGARRTRERRPLET